ncbi:MAG: shikimate kinase, partial [Flavobacteriaceae bacterium]|nr:shikimate kinase [Flavobacteriaceae bacterium]
KILLNKKTKSIISLGGGTPCYHNNMDFILECSKNVFFIKTSAEVLSFRLFKEKSKRPIIKSISSISELKDFISKHLFERMIFYSQAHHIIDDNDKGADSVCKKIVSKLI